jgi:hypothetical protein
MYVLANENKRKERVKLSRVHIVSLSQSCHLHMELKWLFVASVKEEGREDILGDKRDVQIHESKARFKYGKIRHDFKLRLGLSCLLGFLWIRLFVWVLISYLE